MFTCMQSLEEGAGKRCSECGLMPHVYVHAEFGGRCRKAVLGVWVDSSARVNNRCRPGTARVLSRRW